MKASSDEVRKAYDMICKRINSILAEAVRPDSMKGFVILADNTLAVKTERDRMCGMCEVGMLKKRTFGQWMKMSSDMLNKKDLVALVLKSAKKHDIILIGFWKTGFCKTVIKKGETIENLIVEHDLSAREENGDNET